MLKENEDVISFVPGYRSGTKTVLGRIVVHDRVSVECKVLPRYFNHNSFASLRRQLNYFSFVRLGKGRQRESTYLNDSVILLDDILNLKRRSSGTAGPAKTLWMSATLSMGEGRSPCRVSSSAVHSVHRRSKAEPPKRRLCQSTAHPSCSSIVSDDEQSHGQVMCLSGEPDLVASCTDDDVLAGCNALLGLSAKGWATSQD